MKFKNYKQLLEKINDDKEVILNISLWTHNSKRMFFKIPFNQVKKHFCSDMFFTHSKNQFRFFTVEGKEFKFRPEQLRIVKIDTVEFI